MNPTTGFQQLLDGNTPRPRSEQAPGLQLATIVDVSESTARFTLLSDSRHVFGPAPFGRGFTPQPGDVAVVAFIGTGIDRPWVLACAAPSQAG